MKAFLIVYDRLAPRNKCGLVRCEELTPTVDEYLMLHAEHKRGLVELEYFDRPEIEVVVLYSYSLDTAKKTHARYFYTALELCDR